jgi:protein-S-isoprenylcysteine O-methyltransferase Ste14
MREALKDRVAMVLAALLVLLVVVEWLFAPHYQPRFAWHVVPGYAALIGLVSSLVVVQLTKTIGKWLLQRPESDDD